MAFNIDPKDLNLQDAAGMQLVEIIRNLAKESGATGGLSDEAKRALMDCFENVAWANDDGQIYYDALYEALFGTTPVTPTLESISAVFTQGTAVIYDTDSLNTLKQYLVVTATYSDSSTETVNDYTLSGTLTAGTSTITVSYGGKTDTFTVNVTASVTLVSISAVFTQGAAVIYDTDSLDTLKQYLVVTATYSDSSTATVNDYTLSGTLTAGTSTITASYEGQSDTFTVNVTAAPTLVSISAVFTQGTAVIYETDSLDTLKQYLVVTATYSDSSTETVNDYTLSGTLTSGTSTITVTYDGETTTFNATVTAWDFEWEYSQGTPIGNGFDHSSAVVGTMVANGYQITGAESGGCNIITDPSTDSSKGVTEIIISYSSIPSSYITGAVHFDVNKLFAVIASKDKLYYSKNGTWGENFEEFANLSLNTDYKFRLEWDDSSGAKLWMNDVLAYEITTALTASRTRWFLTATTPSATAVVKAMRVKVVS